MSKDVSKYTGDFLFLVLNIFKTLNYRDSEICPLHSFLFTIVES